MSETKENGLWTDHLVDLLENNKLNIHASLYSLNNVVSSTPALTSLNLLICGDAEDRGG